MFLNVRFAWITVWVVYESLSELTSKQYDLAQSISNRKSVGNGWPFHESDGFGSVVGLRANPIWTNPWTALVQTKFYLSNNACHPYAYDVLDQNPESPMKGFRPNLSTGLTEFHPCEVSCSNKKKHHYSYEMGQVRVNRNEEVFVKKSTSLGEDVSYLCK